MLFLNHTRFLNLGFYISLLVCISTNLSSAQGCYPNGLIFSSQADVDLFPTVNPGCKVIEGNLWLDGEGITNLDSLYPIEVIEGDFAVFPTGLSNFNGLHNLDTIGRAFRMLGNNSITNFQGLGSLKKIGTENIEHRFVIASIINFVGLDSLTTILGDMKLQLCNVLTSFEGLENITNLQKLRILQCENFISFDGLDNVTSIEDIELMYLDDMTSLNGLGSLENINKFELMELPSLNSVSQLTALTTVNTLRFDNCDSLTTLNGLESLTSIATELSISNNELLSDISAIEGAGFMNSSLLTINDNPALSMCNYPSICEFIDSEGDATIFNNDPGCNGITEVINACCTDNVMWCPEEMETCYGNGIIFSSQAEIDLYPSVSPGCKIIGGDLIIDGLGITNLDSLYSLEKVVGDLVVLTSDLTNFDGLINLDTIHGALSINGDQSIVNFEGLKSLKKIGSQDSYHYFNCNITDFKGLDSIVTILGNLQIENCNGLISLCGLENLTILPNVSITSCSELTSLDGLENVITIEDLELNSLPKLQNLTGLNVLENVNIFKLIGLLSLQSISQLTGLTSIDDWTISSCDSLVNLNGLINLNSITTELMLSSNGLLSDISDLENVNLTSLDALRITDNMGLSICNYTSTCSFIDAGGFVEISNNDIGCNGTVEVVNACCMADTMWCPASMDTCYVDGIIFSSQEEIDLFPSVNPGCKIIGGNVIIDGLGIVNLDSLSLVENVLGDFIVYSSGLTNFEGLNQLDTIFGTMIIDGDQSLVDFTGLESLKRIGNEDSQHYFQCNITNFIGLDSLTSILGEIEIDQCTNLTSLLGLEGLTSLKKIRLEQCNGLVSLQGLDNVTFIHSIFLSFCENLTSLDGLNSLDSAYTFTNSFLTSLVDVSALSNLSGVARLKVQWCSSLPNLNGLDSLEIIEDFLWINNNGVLKDLDVLENTDLTNLALLDIHDNPLLSVCRNGGICEFLDIDGNTQIHGNDYGCNGTIEIEYDCVGLLSVFETTTSSFTGDSDNNYWHNPENWRNNVVPIDSSYVILPPGYDSYIQSDSIANCKILIIEPGASVTSGSGSILNVTGKQ